MKHEIICKLNLIYHVITQSTILYYDNICLEKLHSFQCDNSNNIIDFTGKFLFLYCTEKCFIN